MARWHCHIGGKQYGPADEDTLRAWIQEGRLGGEHLVWSDGLAEWIPARKALPHLFQSAPPPIASALVTAPPPGGTNGSTPNAQLAAQAREILSGNWGKIILFSALYSLLGIAIGSIPRAGRILSLILSGALELGLVTFFLSFARRGPSDYSMLFSGFRSHSIGRAIGACLLRLLLVFLWSLLLIVPGFIASLAYSQTFYLLADDKTLGPLEALRKSKQLMHGFKWKCFCLGLRFLGWMILWFVPPFIGGFLIGHYMLPLYAIDLLMFAWSIPFFLFLWPYMLVSFARFYDDLAAPRAPQIVAQASATQPGPAEPNRPA